MPGQGSQIPEASSCTLCPPPPHTWLCMNACITITIIISVTIFIVTLTITGLCMNACSISSSPHQTQRRTIFKVSVNQLILQNCLTFYI